MIIAVDHGNKQIKLGANGRVFTSGLQENDTRPPFGEDILKYKDKYYTISDKRIPVMRDKTIDDRSAAMPVYGVINSLPKVMVIDIGGFTADYLLIKNGQADLSVCDSLENGVIIL